MCPGPKDCFKFLLFPKECQGAVIRMTMNISVCSPARNLGYKEGGQLLWERNLQVPLERAGPGVLTRPCSQAVASGPSCSCHSSLSSSCWLDPKPSSSSNTVAMFALAPSRSSVGFTPSCCVSSLHQASDPGKVTQANRAGFCQAAVVASEGWGS